MAGADIPADTLAVTDRRAVGHGLGALAADLVQAPALLGPLVTPGQRELAELEERPALAPVVDEVRVGEERATHRVRRRELSEGEVVDDRGDEVLHVERAPGQRHQLPVSNQRTDPAGPGPAATGSRGPTIERARAHGQGGQGPVADLTDHVGDRAAALQTERTARARRDGPLDHGEVALRVTLHRVGAGQLGGGPRRREERLVVLHRQRLEQERSDGRIRRPQEGLRVAAAPLAADPDDRQAGGAGHGRGDPRRVAGWEREGGGHRRGELEERSAGHPPPHQCGVQPVLAHGVPLRFWRHRSGRGPVTHRLQRGRGDAGKDHGRRRGVRDVPDVAAMGGEGHLDRALMGGNGPA